MVLNVFWEMEDSLSLPHGDSTIIDDSYSECSTHDSQRQLSQ